MQAVLQEIKGIIGMMSNLVTSDSSSNPSLITRYLINNRTVTLTSLQEFIKDRIYQKEKKKIQRG
jgi:hypothetical protein